MKSLFFLLFLFISTLQAEMIGSYDKDFLLAYAKNHPKDLKSRELLLAYFYKKEDKKMIVRLSEEIYSINPNDKILKDVVGQVYKKELKEKIVLKLKEFYSAKEYIKYINLYQSLQDVGRKIPNLFHVNALYSAVEVSDYKLAKRILGRKDLPMSPHLSEVMQVLDKKLHSEKSL